VCILGNAAGTMSQLMHTHFGAHAVRIDGVEIDPAVTEASRRAMGLDPATHRSLRIVHDDGRAFLRGRPEGAYDAIVLDAYARQASIPAGLATREFFALVKSRLREGGMLFANLGTLRPGSGLVRIFANTIAAGFGSDVFRAPMHEQSNVLLVARRGGDPAPPPKGSALLIDASFARHVAGGEVLTDDHCPIESLTAKDLALE
jgi:spermidine synthase